jgi:hypothetical protein
LLVLSYLYRCAVTIAALAILYAVTDVLRQGEPHASGRILLVVVGALAVAAGIAVWSRHSIAVSVQLVAIPFLAALYVFEARQKDPVEEVLHLNEFWDMMKARRATGPTSIQYTPTSILHHPDGGFALGDNDHVFVVSAGTANIHTVMCREGVRPFAEYDADEHGFNNPGGIWGKPVDLVFVGDSMTFGACVPNRDHFIAQVREKYPATLNLGVGGIGPLIELAIMREYLPHTRPKYVFYVYDENNDLYFVDGAGAADLANERKNPILRKYVTDDRFSQRLFERRAEIADFMRRYMDGFIDQALESRTPQKRAIRFLGLPLTRAGLPPIEWPLSTLLVGPAAAAASTNGDDLELFKKILSNMLQASADAGARFVFVNIPAQGTICNGTDHPLKKPVLDFVAQNGVDIIDLEQDYRTALKTIGREIFAEPPCGGHFSERGYKIIGPRLLKYLAAHDATNVSTRPQ